MSHGGTPCRRRQWSKSPNGPTGRYAAVRSTPSCSRPPARRFWATSPTESTHPPLELEASGYAHERLISIPIRTSSGYWSETEQDKGELAKDDIAVLETNLDDATPEVLGGLQETLADAALETSQSSPRR